MKSFAITLCLTFISLLFTSPTHAKMVYLYQVGNDRQVALADDKGQFIQLLTSKDQQAYHPEISADGRYVAYSIGTIQPDTVDVAIHVQDLKTGNIEVWTPSGDQYIHAEFSGDGKYLAYSGPVTDNAGKTTQNIQLINLEKERAKGPQRSETKNGVTYNYFVPEVEVIHSDYDSYFPAVASDASFVIYHRTKDASTKKSPKELVQYQRASQDTKLLTAENGHAMVPSLSFDNRHLAYAGIRNDQWDIHVIDLWTQEDRQITDNPAREFTPVFAPDGSITYTHITEGEELQLDLYRISKEAVFSKDVQASPVPFVADQKVAEYVPAFSGTTEFSLNQEPSFPEPARSSFAATEYKGKIYIAGGHQGPEHTYPPESFLDRLDIYDQETGQWSQGASLNVPRHGFEMVAHDGFLYAFGGFSYSADHDPQWKSLNIVERYDIAKDKWEILPAQLPRRRSSNVAVKVDDRVYLIGGWDSTPKYKGDKEGDFHGEIDIFNLNSETATVSDQRLPEPRRRAFTAVEKEGRVYLLGGITEGASHFDWLNNVTAFEPETGRWQELTPLPFATFAPGAGIYNGKLYLFGGMNKKLQYVNTIFAKDLDQQEWKNTGRFLNENKGFPIVVDHPQGGLGILGGHTYKTGSDGIVDTPVSTFEHLH